MIPGRRRGLVCRRWGSPQKSLSQPLTNPLLSVIIRDMEYNTNREDKMERKPYNASLISKDESGKIVSTTIGYVEDGKILAAAGFWSHKNWTHAYDADW